MEWSERKKIYNKEYHKGFVDENDIPLYLKSESRAESYKQCAQKIYDICQPESILDCGCASAWLEYGFYLLGKPIIRGFDISEYIISVVPDKIRDWVFHCDITEGIHFEDNSFQMAVLRDILEHLHNYELLYKSVSEICRVCSKYILLCMPFAYYTTELSDINDRNKFLIELNILPHKVRVRLIGIHPYLIPSYPKDDELEHPLLHPRGFWIELFDGFGFKERQLDENYYIYPNELDMCSFNVLFFERK